GVVLYEMASGRRPFSGDSEVGTLTAILRDEPSSLRSYRESIPKTLDHIVTRCLDKDPEKRYPTASHLRDELAALRAWKAAGSRGVRGQDHCPIWFRRLAAGLGIVFILVLAALWIGLPHGELPKSTGLSYSLATGSTKSSYYAVGTGIANLLKREIEGLGMEVLESGGSLENARLIDRNEAQLGLMQNDVAFDSVMTDKVLGHRSDRLVALLALYQDEAHVLVRSDGDIQELEDLRGRKVHLTSKGDGGRFSSESVFAHFGMDIEILDGVSPAGPEAIRGLQDGSVSASMFWSPAPVMGLMPMLRSGTVELLSLEEKSIRGLRLSHPFLIPVVIPRHTYPRQAADIDTIAVTSLLVGSADLPDEFVEDTLTAIFDNVPDLIAAHPRSARISFDTAFRLENGISIPLHPAAKRFAETE
ncbi:MAG: TAXI family TRAP transporter solute-binding subunit, partial [Acidobacteriota bacterium]